MAPRRPAAAPPRPSIDAVSLRDGPARALLAGALATALALRLAALHAFAQSVYWRHLVIDESIYHAWAERIASGTFRASAVYQFSPLPAYVHAALYWVFGPDPVVVRWMNVGLGVGAVGLAYVVGARTGGRAAGLAAAWLLALAQPAVLYSAVPLPTEASLVAAGLLLWLLLRAADRRTFASYLLLGAAAGVFLGVRGQAMVLLPFLPVLAAWAAVRAGGIRAALRPAAAYAVGLAITVAPFTVRNWVVAGEFALITSQSGFALYLGNNLESPDPYLPAVPFAMSTPLQQGTEFAIEASRRTGAQLSPQQASAYWTREVFRLAMERPVEMGAKLGRKLLAAFHRFEACDHYGVDFLRDHLWFLRLPLVPFWVLSVLGAFGAVAAWRRSPGARLLAAAAALYVVPLVLFHSNGRYRLPLLAMLVPLAGVGLCAAVELARAARVVPGRWRDARAPLAAAAAALALAFAPLRGAGDLGHYLDVHAAMLAFDGRIVEAERYWGEASRRGGAASPGADVVLARGEIARGDPWSALARLTRIPDSSHVAGTKHETIGDARAALGDVAGAEAAYERSLEINGSSVRVRSKLAALLLARDPDRARYHLRRRAELQRMFAENDSVGVTARR